MNKEALIKAILAALTAGTAGALATIVITQDMLRDPETAKYAKTIRLQQRLLMKRDALNRYIARYVAHEKKTRNVEVSQWTIYRTDPKAKEMKVRLNKLVDELIAYTMSAFDDGSDISEEAEFLCSDIFEGWVIADTMSIDGLKAIIDVVIPTATLRYIIQQKVQVDTLLANNFVPFASRYKNMIMGRSRPLEDRVRLYPDSPKAQNIPYWIRMQQQKQSA